MMLSYQNWKRNKKIMREKPELWLLDFSQLGYIQIPKVATRSIQQCLASHYVRKEKLDEPLHWDKEAIRLIESKIAFHTTQEKISKISENNFIFAFVRNPYDRLLSAYKNKVLQPIETGGKNIFINHGITLGMPLEEFIDIVCGIPDEKIDRHLRSQSWFLTFKGKLIPHYIGHLETFDKDWNELSVKFDLPIPEHRNSTVNLEESTYVEELSTEIKSKIWKRYQQDFLMFNYEAGF